MQKPTITMNSNHHLNHSTTSIISIPFLLSIIIIIISSCNLATTTLAQADSGTGGRGGGDSGNGGGDSGNGGGDSGNEFPPVGRCSIDIFRLAVCTPLVTVDVGSLASRPCCAALLGLVDLEATVCLCLALRANVLGIHMDVPLALNLIISTCYSSLPPYYFECR